MSVELIKNIKALTKIQLKQSKNTSLKYYTIVIVTMLITNLDLIQYKSENVSFFTNIGSVGPFFILGICMLLAIMSINILANQSISMYPGTSISRLISRILSDNIIILKTFVFTFLLYYIDYLILLAIKGGGADISITFAFDMKYALVSIIYVLSYYLLAYGVFCFIYTLATSLGVKKTIISYTSVFIIFVMFAKYNLISLFNILDYFRDEKSLGLFMLKTWSIWLITILLALLIAKSFKVMREEASNAKFIMIPIGFIIIMIFAFSTSLSSTSKSESYTSISKFQQLKGTDIYKETLVKCDNLSYKKMANEYRINFNYISQTDAYKAGILEDNYSLNNEVLVTAFFPGVKCKNQYIYQYYLDNMIISYEDSMLNISCPTTKTILNFLWGDSYKFIKGYDLNNDGSLYSSGMGAVCVFIIAPDNLISK